MPIILLNSISFNLSNNIENYLEVETISYTDALIHADLKTQTHASAPDYMNFNLINPKLSSTISPPVGETNIQGLTLSLDGRYLYTTGRTTDKVYQYELTENWNIATATLINDFDFLSATGDTNVAGILWKPDGTKCYIVGDVTNRVYQFSASTPYDITTFTLEKSQTFVSGGSNISDIEMRPDGKKLFVQFDIQDTLEEHDLSTAWEIDTAVEIRSINLNDFGISAPQSTMIHPCGDVICFSNNVSGGVIQCLHLNIPWSLEDISSGEIFDITAPSNGLFFSYDGSRFYATTGVLDEVEQWDLSACPRSIVLKSNFSGDTTNIDFVDDNRDRIGKISVDNDIRGIIKVDEASLSVENSILKGSAQFSGASDTSTLGFKSYYGCTDTTLAFTFTISSADIAKGSTERYWVFTVKDESGGAATNNITIDTEGSETIDGAASVSITTNYGFVTLASNGTNLFTI